MDWVREKPPGLPRRTPAVPCAPRQLRTRGPSPANAKPTDAARGGRSKHRTAKGRDSFLWQIWAQDVDAAHDVATRELLRGSRSVVSDAVTTRAAAAASSLLSEGRGAAWAEEARGRAAPPRLFL